jgi:hypothetical protein
MGAGDGRTYMGSEIFLAGTKKPKGLSDGAAVTQHVVSPSTEEARGDRMR